MRIDHAETANIEKLIARIGAGLDQFLKFEHEDCLRSQAKWRERLDVPLPGEGVGLDPSVKLKSAQFFCHRLLEAGCGLSGGPQRPAAIPSPVIGHTQGERPQSTDPKLASSLLCDRRVVKIRQ